jgi:hypothetical protein
MAPASPISTGTGTIRDCQQGTIRALCLKQKRRFMIEAALVI